MVRYGIGVGKVNISSASFPRRLLSMYQLSIMANSMEAAWTKLAEHDILQGSAHKTAVINKRLYVFGGELLHHRPCDGDMHVLKVEEAG